MTDREKMVQEATRLESRGGWRWFGYAGHFIMARDCAFHMSTLVAGGRRLVSTVGDMNNGGDVGLERKYETFVFKANGTDENGDPNVLDWCEIDGTGYTTSREAEAGHYDACYRHDEADHD